VAWVLETVATNIQNTWSKTVRYETYLAGTAIFISLLVIDQRVSAWL